MATQGQLTEWQTAVGVHGANIKKLVHEAKQLRDYWDKLDINTDLGTTITAALPQTTASLQNYATILSVIQDFLDNVAVPAADRRAIIEQVASTPVA